MAISVSRKNYGTGGSGVSTQGQVLQHFLDSMEDIRACVGGKDEAKAEKRLENFLLLTIYLRKLIPNREVQDAISIAIAEKKQQYLNEKTFSSEELATYASQLETLTEVMIYLNQGMDLIHNDAVGAMTRRAAQHAKEPVTPPTVLQELAQVGST